MDIICQPLIEFEGTCYISPNLVLGSNIDRNFQVLLTKLPHRRKEFDRLKNLKEMKMISDISPHLKKSKISYKPNIKLKEGARVFTDIDLLLWDSDLVFFLIIQLKWFYGADSTQEVYNHDVWFDEGIQKTKEVIKYFQNNYERILENQKIEIEKIEFDVAGLIVSKTSVPSPFISDPDFIVIEEDEFISKINEVENNVSLLYDRIKEQFIRNRKFPSKKLIQEKVEFGEYTFVLPAIEIDGVDPNLTGHS